MLWKHLHKDCEGAALVEFAAVFPLLLVLIGGIVDFSLVLWQMNMATKAVERGARIAAVSDPVATGLTGMSTVVAGGTPGDPLPDTFTFEIICTSDGCSGGYDLDVGAMDTIVYGRGNGNACNTSAAGPYAIGMCNLFNRVDPAGTPLEPKNVVVEYRAAPAVGFQGRPCGPVATVTVSLKDVSFGWFFLKGLLSFADLSFPPMRTTITSEDLSLSSPLACP